MKRKDKWLTEVEQVTENNEWLTEMERVTENNEWLTEMERVTELEFGCSEWSFAEANL